MGLGRNFWLFAIGRFVSQLGWAIQDVALPLYVLDKTQSGSMMSLFVLAEIVPSLIVMPFAGVIGDRYNRKWLMVGFDLARGVLLFGVVAFNLLGIHQLLALQVVMAVLNSFFSAGTGAMFPDLVDKELLEKANSTVSSLAIMARLLGPALGGLIYGIGGIKLAMLINAVSFFGSGLFEILIEYDWKGKLPGSHGRFLEDIREGLRFMLENPYLRAVAGLSFFISLLSMPLWTVVVPYGLRVVLGLSSLEFGLLESAFMAGALLGNLTVARLGRGAGKYLFWALFADELSILAFVVAVSSLFASVPLLFVVSLVGGVCASLIEVPIRSRVQRTVPAELRGRVFSALGLLGNAAIPIGLLVVGPLLNVYPVWLVALGIWLGMLLVTAYYWLRHGEELT